MRATQTSDLWWKSAVIYCLDVETFLDTDGDGTGDLTGLAERIDYLAELGINCLWLMPFYPSPDRDDGYDVTDFYGVDDRLGSLGQLVEVIRTAHDRGIRVIADLIINHTSDQHPWFRAARSSRDSKYRDFYVWRDTEPRDTSDEVVFPDEEDAIWTKDERTGEWYLHHFYHHQPDLNVANPAVRDEIMRVIGFWLELGIDGFRVDAVPFFIEDVDTSRGADEDPAVPSDPHQILKEIRAFLNRRKGSAMMLGEVNIPHEQQLEYFGGQSGDELTMMFDFVTMQASYLALARMQAEPIVTALQGRPRIHPACQWANFLRNHDELTLDKLTDDERHFGRGLKRRLPPMLGGDPRRIRMAYSLMLSLPGTPTLYYGEEIGMGEDLAAEGRMAVRTPMQWSDGRCGGFSSAAPSRLIQRPVPDGYGPDHVNVKHQRHDPDSLWTSMRELIGVRRSCPELGWGEPTMLDSGAPQVLAHRCDLDGSAVLAVHNLGADPVSVSIEVEGLEEGRELVDLLDRDGVPLESGPLELALPGYGFHWYRLGGRGQFGA